MIRPAAEAIGTMTLVIALAAMVGGALPHPADRAVLQARAAIARAADDGLDRLVLRLGAALDRAARRLAGD